MPSEGGVLGVAGVRLLHGEFWKLFLSCFLRAFLHLIVEQGTEDKSKKINQAFEFVVHDFRGFVRKTS